MSCSFTPVTSCQAEQWLTEPHGGAAVHQPKSQTEASSPLFASWSAACKCIWGCPDTSIGVLVPIPVVNTHTCTVCHNTSCICTYMIILLDLYVYCSETCWRLWENRETKSFHNVLCYEVLCICIGEDWKGSTGTLLVLLKSGIAASWFYGIAQ